MRHWPRSITTFFAQFGLVWEKRQYFCLCSNAFLYAYLFCPCLAPAASIPEQGRRPRIVGGGDSCTRGRCWREGRSRHDRAHHRGFSSRGHCSTGQHNPLCQGCGGPCRSCGERGTVADIQSRGRKCHNACPAREDVKGLAWMVALLEDELAAKHQARVMSEREHRARFEELTLL
jgi:hypothetical protein